MTDSGVVFEGRRLTGAGFHGDGPAAIIEAEIPAADAGRVVAAWQEAVERLYSRLGLPVPETAVRLHDRGQSLYFPAPIDTLYAAVELSETALRMALGEMDADEVNDYLEDLATAFREESRPRLRALEEMAMARGVPFLWDDDMVSLGQGACASTWPVGELPDPDSLDWNDFGKIPVALVTGTNGKSTTTRLCSHIAGMAGRIPGFSSTDGIWAGSTCLDTGDWSGPGGAREVLRHNGIDCAILEVARGGLLRRGLGVPAADVAVITNVAEDHLGEYGVNTLADLIETKFIVGKAVRDQGVLVLNADDDGIVHHAQRLDQDIVWFSLDADNALIRQQQAQGRPVWTAESGEIRYFDGKHTVMVCEIRDIPICLGGRAAYNVANALAAAAVCTALGFTPVQIRQGLISFDSQQDNPGRGNIIEKEGVSIMVDFAHNPHGLNAVVDTLLQLPASRRLVMIGHAGDRSNEDIEALTEVALRLEPSRVVIYELEAYLRGRQPGEIPGIIRNCLAANGYSGDQVIEVADPVSGAREALAWSREGDFLLLLVLDDRDRVIGVLEEYER